MWEKNETFSISPISPLSPRAYIRQASNLRPWCWSRKPLCRWGVDIARSFATVASFCLLLALLGTAVADEPIEFNLLRLQSSQKATQSLRSPARFLWNEQALRDAVAGVGKAYSLTIWIDRRIDPTQSISYSPQAGIAGSELWPRDSLGARLEQALRSHGVHTGLAENVLVVGHHEDVVRMQAAAVRLHDAIHRLNPQLASEARPLQWQELTTPQQLIDQLAKQWGVTIQGDLPHDLMHAGKFQEATTLATQLALVCGGFSLEVVTNGPRSFALQPIQDEPVWTAVYPRNQLLFNELSAVRKRFPEGNVRTRNDLYTVQGDTNFHLAVQASQPAVRTGKVSERATWSFQIANAPVEAIMNNLASGIDLEIIWDPSCTDEQKRQLINLQVDEAALDELLKKVCDAAGLTFVRQGEKVTLQPR